MHSNQTSMKPEQKQMPHPKSPGGNSGIDVEAELGIQPVRRPTGIDQDVSNLGQTKRVSSVLTSPLFKEELETVVTDLLRSGDGGGHVIAREIANMLSPMNRTQYTFGVGSVTPINDITGSDISRYTKGEKLMRCKLAAAYRLVDLNGWSQQIYNHITVKVDKEQEHFLINPYGLMYHEVSAAKLIKINMQGDVIDQGTTAFGVNKAGFVIHSAIHAGRPDINCIIQVHVPDVIAVSMMDCGLLPISQPATIVGDISYHGYHGGVVDQKEKKLLVKHLGPVNKVMLLRNHGMLACGETVEEAFSLLTTTILACQTQVKVMSCVKPEKIHLLDKSAMKKNFDSVGNCEGVVVDNSEEEPIKWGMGELMWEAHMRMLDNMGYRTGYMYKNPTNIYRRSRLKGDIEIPASAYGNTIPLDELQEGRSRLHSHPTSRWVNSPNQYTKVQPLSEDGHAVFNGEVSPKNKTTWKNDEGSSHSTPIRITDANQFVPKNTDPREVAEKRRKIRGQGRWDERGPGPQSQKLATVHPTDSRLPTDEDVVTGSKGIIQRQYHEHTVVTGPPNPFSNMNKEEIESYKKEVAQKMKKDSESEEVHESTQENVEHIEVVAEVGHTDEMDGNTGSAPVAQVVIAEVQERLNDMMLTNGHSEPDYTMEEQAEASLSATDQPPKEQSYSQKEVVEIENKEVPKQDPIQSVQEVPNDPPPKEKVKNEPPGKENGKDESVPQAPKVEQKIEESPQTNPGEKNSKGKNKKDKESKKTKRRSLSFLSKKNKEKKVKE